MKQVIINIKIFAWKYQNLVFQVIENGDEIMLLCKSVFNSLVQWSVIIMNWF